MRRKISISDELFGSFLKAIIFLLPIVWIILNYFNIEARANPQGSLQDSSGLDTMNGKSSTVNSIPEVYRSGNAYAGSDSSAPILAVKSPPNPLDRVIHNKAFGVGEKLTFNIRYGIIKAGEATMEVRGIVNLNDSIPVYHIVTTARSAKFFDAFYKVRDEVETFIDTKGFFSRRYHKRLREGGYKYDLLVDYDQAGGLAHVEGIRYDGDEELKVRNREMFQLEIPQYVLDVLAAFYYVRTQKLELGMPLYMSNHDNKKVYDLQVIVQKKERVKVDAGTFNCVMVQPRLQGDAIFQQKGELWIWLTDDEYKIPVQMKSKVAVGSITTELKKIEGVPLPIKARVK